jgi:minor extracellular serine protease Vpr
VRYAYRETIWLGKRLGWGHGLLPAGSLAGQVALISRGTCSFSTKIRNAQDAGALAVLIVNNAIGDPVPMEQDGTLNQPTIPAYMLSQQDGLALVPMNGAVVTISAAVAYFQTPNSDIMASFSGSGPTMVDFRIKPDVVAPGVSVLSSIPLAYCGGSSCFAFGQGTSMATPHLAGSAAIVHWLYPEWSAAEVRSAIVNTADDNTLKDWVSGAPLNDVNIVGAGRENLLSAVNASVALDPVHGELQFRLQLAVQTTRGNGFANDNSQGRLLGVLGHPLSRQVCRRIVLDGRDPRCSSF